MTFCIFYYMNCCSNIASDISGQYSLFLVMTIRMSYWNCVRSFCCPPNSNFKPIITIRNIVPPPPVNCVVSWKNQSLFSLLIIKVWTSSLPRIDRRVHLEECSLIKWYRALCLHIMGEFPETVVGHSGQWEINWSIYTQKNSAAL